jgi:hypothetical protein
MQGITMWRIETLTKLLCQPASDHHQDGTATAAELCSVLSGTSPGELWACEAGCRLLFACVLVRPLAKLAMFLPVLQRGEHRLLLRSFLNCCRRLQLHLLPWPMPSVELLP